MIASAPFPDLYVKDPVTGVWSRPGYGGIAYSDGDEVETRLMAALRASKDVSVLSSDLVRHCIDWPSLYHFSANRANLLRPLESLLKGSVLEIGAGCGAITRYLGECGGAVVALEGSPRRAAIARERTRDLPNVSVVAERFDDFVSSATYDAVTLIGVLEYANLFMAGPHPARAMLERARSFLRPGGCLIVAIENQLGLKYFAGAREDHLGVPMYGLEDRYTTSQAQTYGLRELSGLLTDAGFAGIDAYAPFPDYKLPTTVVSGKGFEEPHFDAATPICQSVRRDPQLPPVLTFSPELAWPVVVRNGLGMHLANSFLLVAHTEPAKKPASECVLAWHYAAARHRAYCKEVRFVRTRSGIGLQYRRLDPVAEQVADSPLRFSLPATAAYEHGRLLSSEWLDIVTRDGWSMTEVGQFLRRYLAALQSLDAENDSIRFDDPAALVPGEYFDRLPHNIIVNEAGEFRLIDEEWVSIEPLPVGLLVFRALVVMLQGVSRLGVPLRPFGSTLGDFLRACMAELGWDVTEAALMGYLRREVAVQRAVAGQPPLGEDEARKLVLSSAAVGARHAYEEIEYQARRIQELEGIVAQNAGRLQAMERELASCNEAIAQRDASIMKRDETIQRMDAIIRERGDVIAYLQKTLDEVLNSRSWRITRPLRFFGGRLFRRKV